MKTLYDVQQLLKEFNILVYVGRHRRDVELMALGLDNLHHAGVINQEDYLTAKPTLRREREIEEKNGKES